MPLINDLNTVKLELSIDPANTAEDARLLDLIQVASEWIMEYLDRPGLFYGIRTEYYQGTGTQKLLLRSRPVYQTYVDSNNVTQKIQVFLDEQGYYGEASIPGVTPFDPNTTLLTYGQDYGLKLDQPDGTTSRSGILFRINNLWPRPSSRIQGLLAPFISEDFGSIKVTYAGGYLVDNLPAQIRYALTTMVARMRQLLPIGLVLAGESYEERAIQYADPFGAGKSSVKTYIMALAAPMLWSFRNWRF